MEKIVVSDTNIFIDLISVNLLDGFFSLPWEIHTTDDYEGAKRLQSKSGG